jgi:ArsR family transcriptional regulator, arsenate/arsenite/antimonite-responsive transcriptional repressor / arsenate reductase (thioredoxin)
MTDLAVPAPPAPEVRAFFKLLADETRLGIVRRLARTDLRVGELVAAIGVPQNTVSYHLKQLRALGLLRAHPSTADVRDVYYQLEWARLQALYHAVGQTLHPGLVTEAAPAGRDRPLRVLFLCTHNSARSQLAEALLRDLGGAQVQVWSAGRTPAAAVHPDVLALLAGWGVDTRGLVPMALKRFRARRFDYVITVCDRTRERCPTFPGEPVRIHWSCPDPAAIANAATRRQVLAQLGQDLRLRLRYLLSLPPPTAAVTREATS